MTPKKPRVALTKAQIQAGLGAELLALCQGVTADGRLTNAELVELRNWLVANRSADLPAIGFLVTTLERILADGKVTREERKELYAAIEKVLPPEVRREAAGQRRLVEAQEKEETRREREAEKQHEREERERRRPLYSMNFMVAGVPYEGRSAIVARYVAEGDPVYLARDPDNEFSRNAVEVRIGNGMQVGFVPEDYAPDVAPLLDAGHPHEASVVKIIGYRYTIPVVRAYVYRPDADVGSLVFPDQVPPKRHYVSVGRSSGREEVEREEPSQGPLRHTGRGCLVLLPLACIPATVAAARAVGLLG